MRRVFSCAASPEYSLAIASKVSCLTKCWAEPSNEVRTMATTRNVFMAMRVQESLKIQQSAKEQPALNCQTALPGDGQTFAERCSSYFEEKSTTRVGHGENNVRRLWKSQSNE